MGLCFNCLNADDKTARHNSARDCPLPKECSVNGCKASKKHHTILHFDEKRASQSQIGSIESHCTDTQGKEVFFPAFPVVVKSTVTGKEITTWAGIDSYSSACFCDRDVLEELSIEENEKPIELKTLNGVSVGQSTIVSLSIAGANGENWIDIPEVYSWEKLPIGDKHMPSRELWSAYDHLKDLPISGIQSGKVKVLIGSNIPAAHQQLEWRQGSKPCDPVAVRYPWGWTLLGGTPSNLLECNFISVKAKEEELSQQLLRLAEFDYAEIGTKYHFNKPTSADDVKAKEILDLGSYLCDGHYYMPVPLKESYTEIQNNRDVAMKRLMGVKSKLKKGKLVDVANNVTELDCYKDLFKKYREKGYIRRIPQDEIVTEEIVNYVPYHHVFHPAKPGKLRLVWDAASEYKGSSLNDHIYSGADEMNSLLGVLLRFRMGGEVAFQADINAMFNQIFVTREHWNLMRFLWFKNDDLEEQEEEYQLLHNFCGGAHAPGNAGYAIKMTCNDNKESFHAETVNTGLRNTYVDDVLKSADQKVARLIVTEIFDLLQKGGFELAKFVTTDRDLLQLVGTDRVAASMKESSEDRVLDIKWNVADDTFGFTTREKNRPMTRRGLLGHISAMFDPEGSIAPVTLIPRQILQNLTSRGIDWDDDLPGKEANLIENWLSSLQKLKAIRRSRSAVPKGFGKIVRRDMHAFSDGSETGLGFVVYTKSVNAAGQVHVCFLFAKALVTPSKKRTIPRIEMQALLLSMRAVKFIVNESDVKWDKIYQWTDSCAVLAMMKNHERRFLPFVANRLQEIRDLQGEFAIEVRHVPGIQNIADICSRGLTIDKFLKCHTYYKGPEFLWKSENEWPGLLTVEKLPDSLHQELKRDETVLATAATTDQVKEPLMQLVMHNSSWTKLKVSVATWLIRFTRWAVETRCGKHPQNYTGQKCRIQVNEMQAADVAIVTYVQMKEFASEKSSSER